MRSPAFHNAFHKACFDPEHLAVLDRAFNDAADALSARADLSQEAIAKLAGIVMAMGEDRIRSGQTLVADDASAITVQAIDRFEATLAPVRE